MEIKMKSILSSVFVSVERIFKIGGLYSTTSEEKLFCLHVNGLINVCLAELGLIRVAKTNIRVLLSSPLYDPNKGLFYGEMKDKEKLKSVYFNACKNSIMALALFSAGYIDYAKRILNSLKASPLYDIESGLFKKEYNPFTNQVNPLFLTQTNLWVALALIQVGKKNEAENILNSLEKCKLNSERGLFFSQDCRFPDSKPAFYIDDQALAILAYLNLGKRDSAKKLIQSVFNSPLYDQETGLFNSSFSEDSVNRAKSTYKNSLMGFALGRLDLSKQLSRLQKKIIALLYDPDSELFKKSTNDETKIPDNSILAITAINFNNLKNSIL